MADTDRVNPLVRSREATQQYQDTDDSGTETYEDAVEDFSDGNAD